MAARARAGEGGERRIPVARDVSPVDRIDDMNRLALEPAIAVKALDPVDRRDGVDPPGIGDPQPGDGYPR